MFINLIVQKPFDFKNYFFHNKIAFVLCDGLLKGPLLPKSFEIKLLSASASAKLDFEFHISKDKKLAYVNA